MQYVYESHHRMLECQEDIIETFKEEKVAEVLRKEDLIREEITDDKPIPYVQSFDSKGLLTLAWSQEM